MTKQHILDEICRTAAANGGTPLGSRRFEQETGIRQPVWFGRYWGRWGDALKEAGFDANTLTDSLSKDLVLEKLIGLARELRQFPGIGDIRLKKRSDPVFPNDTTIQRHLGSRAKQRQAIVEYCASHPGFDDVPALCGEIKAEPEAAPSEKATAVKIVGFVYLMKHGKHFKIGKTNATGRREYELAIQLPDKLTTVHVIKTDDSDGIEAYWHKRFAAKRGNGEWFNLDPSDIQAFKSRKFM